MIMVQFHVYRHKLSLSYCSKFVLRTNVKIVNMRRSSANSSYYQEQ